MFVFVLEDVASDMQAQVKFTRPELFKISPYWKRL